jgi:DNA-binding CsgD family transcriptional regulator
MEKGIKDLTEYGMSPDQIAKALKLPLDKVLQYRDQK